MPITKARLLVEGALLAAVLLALELVMVYIPYVYLIIPLLIALFGVRHGLRYSAMLTGCAALLGGLMIGVKYGVVLFIEDGMVGMLLGECLRRRMSAGRMLALAAVVDAALIALVIGLGLWVVEIDVAAVVALMETEIASSIAAFGHLLQLEGEYYTALEEVGARTAQRCAGMLPAILLAIALFKVGVNIALMRYSMCRLRMGEVRFTPFELWRFPQWTIWMYLFSLAGSLFGQSLPESIDVLCGNVYFVASHVMLVQGASILYYISKRRPEWRRICWGLIAAGYVVTVLSAVLVCLVIYDRVTDHRRIGEESL